ncbi:FHA domain-containing protein [Lusitaniella coriacea]|uniref:FHA domain-containing protein n=1 Tax=Lusitaniella coriacea TaxID=1983105 RepID=UPI003CF15364
MIVCPNCNHSNPDGATQCEACYTPLPVMTNCPNCGTAVQEDASFCGQCGYNLNQETSIPTIATPSSSASSPLPATVVGTDEPNASQSPPDIDPVVIEMSSESPVPPDVEEMSSPPESPEPASNIDLEKESESPPPPPVSAPASGSSATHLQLEQASLLHVQTNAKIEIPSHLSVVHLGKPGGPIPPDIDVSGFPNSSVVSRVHADIRAEGGIYYIEDVGSSNGTYINHIALPVGNRHKLRAGDRIALGKEDKVTFIFQLS